MASVRGHLSIVIPTYDEWENLRPLVDAIARLKATWLRDFDVLFIDDDSPDGTGRLAAKLASDAGVPARVVTRSGPRSLGGSIAEGFRLAKGELICVMDADLSHPPAAIPRLVASLDGADGVVASRYVGGSLITRWPLRRKLVSFGATALARILFQPAVRDPMSGFFLFRRSSLADVAITGLGNKPLLEILAQRRLAVREVPYEFRDRENGRSKLDALGIFGYVRLVRFLRKSGRRNVPIPSAESRTVAASQREP